MNAFREKLLTLQISPKVKAPERRKNYWNQESVDKLIGEDADEIMADDTEGRGPAYRDGRGGFVDAEGKQVDPTWYTEGPEYDGDA